MRITLSIAIEGLLSRRVTGCFILRRPPKLRPLYFLPFKSIEQCFRSLILVVPLLYNSLIFAQPNSIKRADSLYRKADELFDQRKFREAFKQSVKAFNLCQKLGTWQQIVRSMDQVCTVGYRNEGSDSHKAFELLKRTTRLATFNSTQEQYLTLFYYHLGRFYYDLTFKSDSAVYFFNRSIELRKKYYGEESEAMALCYYALGDVYRYKKFNLNLAELCYERALEIRERIGFSNMALLARNYYNLATTNRVQQDFGQAKVYGNKTIDLVAKLNENEFLENCYNMLGNISMDMGNTAEAEILFGKAIQTHLNAPHPRNHTNLAQYYIDLGGIWNSRKDYDKSIQYFHLALAVLKEMKKEDSSLFLTALWQMANAFSVKGEKRTAEEYFNKARLLEAAPGMLKNERSELWRSLGNHFRRNLQLDSATWCYQRSISTGSDTWSSSNLLAVPTLNEIGPNFFLVPSFVDKTHALHQLALKRKDEMYFSAGIKCIVRAEELQTLGRNSLDREDSKWVISDSTVQLYEGAISLLVDAYQYHPADSLTNLAFFFFERSKSKSLSDALASAEAKEKIGVPDSLWRSMENSKSAFFHLQDRLHQEEGSDKPNADQLKSLKAELFRLERDSKRLSGLLETSYPGYTQLKGNLKVPSITDISGLSKKQNTQILEFFWGKKNVYLLEINGNFVRLVRIGAVDSIRQELQDFGAHFSSPNFHEQAFKSFVANSARLYKTLLGHVVKDSNSAKKLLIIPDGPLCSIPFEALLSEVPLVKKTDYRSLPYLVKSADINYGYLASPFVTNVQESVQDYRMLAFSYGGKEKLSGFQPELSGVGHEVEQLEDLFTGTKSFQGELATEGNFKRWAPQFDLIHLAIHGRGDPSDPFSASLFFDKNPPGKEDGELHAYEMYNLKLKARLAVLSACESGIGQVHPGEGVMSMANAFIYSGCRTVVMSFWKVSDQSSVPLMKSFYKGIRARLPIEQALRQAKLEYIDHADELSANPLFWAAYVSYGDPEPLHFSRWTWPMILAVAFLAAVCFVIFWVIRIKRKAAIN